MIVPRNCLRQAWLPLAALCLLPSSSEGAPKKTIQTAPIVMTGKRFKPRQIQSPTMTMSGKRFSPRSVPVPVITMTGIDE